MVKSSRSSGLLGGYYYSSTLSILLVLISCILLIIGCYADARSSSSSSSCGDFRNISFPFRLKSIESKKCIYDEYYSLSCENNQTIYISLGSADNKFQVRSINISYSYFFDSMMFIRVSKFGTDKTRTGDCSSLLSNFDPFRSNENSNSLSYSAVEVMLLKCEAPVKGRKDYIDVSAHCNQELSFINDTHRFHVYALVGRSIQLSDIENSCTVESLSYSSDPRLLKLIDSNMTTSISYQDIHNAVSFGFYFGWNNVMCGNCEKRASCLGYHDPSICSEEILSCSEHQSNFGIPILRV